MASAPAGLDEVELSSLKVISYVTLEYVNAEEQMNNCI